MKNKSTSLITFVDLSSNESDMTIMTTYQKREDSSIEIVDQSKSFNISSELLEDELKSQYSDVTIQFTKI